MPKFITLNEINEHRDTAGNFVEYIKGDLITINLEQIVAIRDQSHPRTKQKYTTIYMLNGMFFQTLEDYERVKYWLEQGRQV